MIETYPAAVTAERSYPCGSYPAVIRLCFWDRHDVCLASCLLSQADAASLSKEIAERLRIIAGETA